MSNDMAGMDPVLDPFDPQTAQAVEAYEAEQQQVGVDTMDQHIRRRKVAYQKVFGNIEDPDVLFVLEDLAFFARAHASAYRPNEREHVLIEGRREVYYRIVDNTRLPHDMLYEKYVQAALQQQRTK